MTPFNYFHVDVFAEQPYSGNGLAVFLETANWQTSFMQKLTQEMQQFESIFLSEIAIGDTHRAKARIFTVEEELPFAGHPILGAAAVLHRTQVHHQTESHWIIQVGSRDIAVTSKYCGNHYFCQMNQGKARIQTARKHEELDSILSRIGLQQTDLIRDLPPQVISTGLDYLILPIKSHAIDRIRICGNDLEAELAKLHAKFVFIFDVEKHEIRTWDNAGRMEDIATGSAAGPAAAYLYHHGIVDQTQTIHIQQGRFRQRPSVLTAMKNANDEILVSGGVWGINAGYLEARP
ncbi:PhzF family phenazine biosynthesis protein [Undibacterium fentianense]|uniref:PhzF family phenazine biosynthesis protein n=1 Tax=Undibacterium fentianense TaxID=2828728 RepID=A0A941E3J0_9BURK|nr:PhzF family phenazine biosynthesis protein [Undibacterium fentianense]MBR7800427.1 PhzF family phenazine biosynthesis protein [Undibacterium fentianense]